MMVKGASNKGKIHVFANAASTIFIYSHMGNQIVERLRIELPRYQIPDILSMNHLVYITKFVLSCKTITFHL